MLFWGAIFRSCTLGKYILFGLQRVCLSMCIFDLHLLDSIESVAAYFDSM